MRLSKTLRLSWIGVGKLQIPMAPSKLGPKAIQCVLGNKGMSKIAITWKKSTIGVRSSQRRTIAGLGLRRLNQTVEHDNTPPIMGMVDKVRHLVEVVHISKSREIDDETT